MPCFTPRLLLPGWTGIGGQTFAQLTMLCAQSICCYLPEKQWSIKAYNVDFFMPIAASRAGPILEGSCAKFSVLNTTRISQLFRLYLGAWLEMDHRHCRYANLHGVSLAKFPAGAHQLTICCIVVTLNCTRQYGCMLESSCASSHKQVWCLMSTVACLSPGKLSVLHVGHSTPAASACIVVQAGGKLLQQSITCLADFAKYDMVINCGGLRGGKLFDDDKVVPIRCRGPSMQ